MIGAFLAGAVAGFGVAIPVGPIAILLMDTALRRGLRPGLAAGAGVATADGIYATIAGIGGAAIAGVIAPDLGAAPVGVGGRARRHRRARARERPPGDGGAAIPVGGSTGAVADPEATVRPSRRATYLRFLGLTIVNPSTVVYFAALVVGLPAVSGGAAERIVFAAGAFLASISWQSFIAVVGAVVHRRLPPSARLYTSLAGNLIVLLLAFNIVRGLFP